MALSLDTYAQAAVPLPDGSWVSSNVVTIAEVIHDFFPTLEVKWLPHNKRKPGDFAFQIVEKCADGAEVVAFCIKDESEFNENLLQKIFQADASRQKNGHLDILERIDANNRAIEAVKAKRHLDAMEEAKELTQSVLNSPLNRYEHNGYRFDLPEQLQPKKVIMDVGVRYQKTRKAGVWG